MLLFVFVCLIVLSKAAENQLRSMEKKVNNDNYSAKVHSQVNCGHHYHHDCVDDDDRVDRKIIAIMSDGWIGL